MGALLAALVLLIVFAALVAVAGTIFWIWMLIDCAANKRLKESERIGWIIAIVFTHLLGALIYFFAARSRKAQATYRQYQPAPPPAQGTYPPYQQGYAAHTASPTQPHPSEQFHWDGPAPQEQAGLEQPQAMYPRVPPQE